MFRFKTIKFRITESHWEIEQERKRSKTKKKGKSFHMHKPICVTRSIYKYGDVAGHYDVKLKLTLVHNLIRRRTFLCKEKKSKKIHQFEPTESDQFKINFKKVITTHQTGNQPYHIPNELHYIVFVWRPFSKKCYMQSNNNNNKIKWIKWQKYHICEGC